MTEQSLTVAIGARLTHFGVAVAAEVPARCAAYLWLLARWNKTINLTALPLDGPELENSIDKLVVEPLVATSVFPSNSLSWFDLGSGGGSPAIPLRIACPGGHLVMVESRGRKCSFLREAVRAVGLSNTTVENVRFEQLLPTGAVDVVTVRAVRVDDGLTDLMAGMIRNGGLMIGFGVTAEDDQRFAAVSRTGLPDGSWLSVSRRTDVPRGTRPTP